MEARWKAPLAFWCVLQHFYYVRVVLGNGGVGGWVGGYREEEAIMTFLSYAMLVLVTSTTLLMLRSEHVLGTSNMLLPLRCELVLGTSKTLLIIHSQLVLWTSNTLLMLCCKLVLVASEMQFGQPCQLNKRAGQNHATSTATGEQMKKTTFERHRGFASQKMPRIPNNYQWKKPACSKTTAKHSFNFYKEHKVVWKPKSHIRVWPCRSTYALSIERISVKGPWEEILRRFPSPRSLRHISVSPSTRSLWEVSCQDPCRRSLYRLSVRDLLDLPCNICATDLLARPLQ